ncbi:MAG TPA: DUF58 domain-containing protein [Candidatus Binataceae bacterium]|nr:DUF58 domain-containing protein [Candidatus Binataceae bacterium]
MLAARAFEPEFLRQLDGLVLGTRHSRTIRAGRRSIGRVLGSGIEPENFREYTEGDDLRFLDWNAFARFDDLTIRTYRAERQVELTILVDASASMGIPERDDKFGMALLLAAALAYVGMSENDPVRLAALSGRRGRQRLEATPFYRRRESYMAFRPFVFDLKCGGETRLAAAISEFLLARRNHGIVILVSDFLVNPTDYEEALSQLVAARHEVKAVHVMGEQECSGSYPPGAYRVRDCETGEMREVTFGARSAELCRERVKSHAERLSGFCTRRGIVYSPAFGASNLDTIIKREFPRLGVIV